MVSPFESVRSTWAYKYGRLDEREAIVAWLRAEAETRKTEAYSPCVWDAIEEMADLLERREHLDKDGTR